MTFDETMRNNPEMITEIATRAFARAKDEAIRENDRRGVPSYGSKDGQIVVRQPPEMKPKITPEEMERRREHVRTAIADSRIEGMAPPGAEELAIFEAYIRGEIEAGDLVTAYLSRPRPLPAF